MDYFNIANYPGIQDNFILSSGNNTNSVYLSDNNNIIDNYNTTSTVQYPIQNTKTEYNYTTNDNQFLNNLENTNYTQNFSFDNNNQLYKTTHYNTDIQHYDNLPYSTEGNILTQTYYNTSEENPSQNKEIVYQDMNNNYNYDTSSYPNTENDVNKYIEQLLKNNELNNNNNSIHNNTFYYSDNVDYGKAFIETNNTAQNIGYVFSNNNNVDYGNTYIASNNNVNNTGYDIINNTNKNYVNYINNYTDLNKQTPVINKGVTIPQKKAITTPNTDLVEVLPNPNNNQTQEQKAPINLNEGIVEILPEQNNTLNINHNDKTVQNNPNTKTNKNNEQQNIGLIEVNQNDNITENNQIQKPVEHRPLTNKDFIDIVNKDIGMINLGNTCYINSCLQILIHCPLFIYKFFNMHSIINIDNTPISFHLFKICVEMMNTVNTQETYIDIEHFKNEFGMKHPIFQGFSQNDSQEFCRVLLEDISTELNEIRSKPSYRELTNNDNKTKVMRDKEFDQHFKQREKSIITDLFYGQIITTFTCQCKAETYSFQKLLDFPLLLPENETNVDIKDLLKTYFQSENIIFETECEKCKKKLEHKKEIKISRPPEILILSLQRIDEKTKNKNECVVNFPQVLDITEFIDHECGFDNEPVYNLYAVINHIGNMECGHYFSYIKMINTKEWYEFNDSVVRKIENNIESFPYAYALFYVKRQKNTTS